MSQEEKAKMVLDDLGDRLPDQFDMEDIRSRVDEVTPYAMVAIQVCVCVYLHLYGSTMAQQVPYSAKQVPWTALTERKCGAKEQPDSF